MLSMYIQAKQSRAESLHTPDLEAESFCIKRPSCRDFVKGSEGSNQPESDSSNVSISRTPPPHAHAAGNRFPQETLPRHQFTLLPQFEFKSPRHSRYDKSQLHLRDISSHARSGTVAERDECALLLLG